MSEEQDNDLEQQIHEASEKLNIDIDVLREISPEEIEYLLARCPFLQIVGPEMALEKEDVKIIQSESGWDIHDYRDAMSSSPGRFLFGGGNFRIYLEEEEDEGGGGVINPGKGTLVNQAWVTASEMMQMAQERGWKFVTIVDGNALMKRAAWVKATELGITLEGFEPTLEDERIRERVLETSEVFQTRQKTIRPKKQ